MDITKHDLLGHLNVIYCYSQILEKTTDIPLIYKGMISGIISQCKDMENIINNTWVAHPQKKQIPNLKQVTDHNLKHVILNHDLNQKTHNMKMD